MKRALVAACLLALPVSRPVGAGEGLVRLHAAAPACEVGSGILADCGNGTVSLHGALVWLQQADCLGEATWQEAMQIVAGLSDLPASLDSECGGPTDTCDCGLSDGSEPGEWRLPSPRDFGALMDPANGVCTDPALTADDGLACWSDCAMGGATCSLTGALSADYWTSLSEPPLGTKALKIDLLNGYPFLPEAKTAKLRVWAVRNAH